MPSPASSPRPGLHPLVTTAAVAVILLSVVGIGAIVMDRSRAEPSAPQPSAIAAAQPAPASTPAAPAAEAVPQPAVGERTARPAEAPPTRVASATPRTPAPPHSAPAPSQPAYEAPRPVSQAPAVCHTCGTVASIRDVKVKGEGSGIGAVGGAVAGGLLGNMIGAGRGKALATVGGAVAGGFGGNAIEKNVRATTHHEMVVRLDDGTTRTFTQASPFPYSEGERVRIVNGHVERG